MPEYKTFEFDDLIEAKRHQAKHHKLYGYKPEIIKHIHKKTGKKIYVIVHPKGLKKLM
jgi:hypothetical protein